MRLNPSSLAVIRILAGHSQASLARTANISQGTVSGLEAGTNNASPSMLRKLADTLGVPVAALITDPTPQQTAEALERVSQRVPPSAATTALSSGTAKPVRAAS